MLVSPLSSSSPVNTNYSRKPGQIPQASPDHKPRGDSVKLSGTAIAKSLELQGLSPNEIAAQMGLDIISVDTYLGITPPSTSSPWHSTLQVRG